MTDFNQLDDAQLATHIHAAVAELKARHAKQEKELAKLHSQQLSGALNANGASKRGPKGKAHAD